jgi:sucrose-6-phosphate hydrolase SacC (GH32 family)
MRQDLPDMPFNQFMTFPCELRLRRTLGGIRLCSWPVQEIELIRHTKYAWQEWELGPGQTALPGIDGELFDIEVQLQVRGRGRYGLNARGIPIVYDAASRVLSCQGRKATLAPIEGAVRLRVLVDRASIEVFANDGEVALPIGVLLDQAERAVQVIAEDEPVLIDSLTVYELKSVWQ